MQAAGRAQAERIGRLVYAQVRGDWLVGEAARLAAMMPGPELNSLLARGRALGAHCQLLSGLFPDPPPDDTEAATAGLIALNEELHRYLNRAGWL